MKVTDNNPIQLDAYTQQMQKKAQRLPNSPQETGASKVPQDKVDLSSAAREIQQVARKAGDVGVVNNEKVQKIKMEVEKGTYKVVGTQVAGDMLKESLENDFILQKINTRA